MFQVPPRTAPTPHNLRRFEASRRDSHWPPHKKNRHCCDHARTLRSWQHQRQISKREGLPFERASGRGYKRVRRRNIVDRKTPLLPLEEVGTLGGKSLQPAFRRRKGLVDFDLLYDDAEKAMKTFKQYEKSQQKL